MNGDTVYTYYLEGITSATDLRFTFIKSPTITYDPNGGKEYVVERQYNTEEAENVYSFKPAADVPDTEAGQYFKIYDGNPQLTKSVIAGSDVTTGVTWTDNGETIDYANDHKGLTMVAQWRWRQAFIPQLGSGDTYTDSADGGTVEITSVTNTSDTNYNAAYNVNGGKSYHAETDETVTAKATAKDDFIFEGWYDGICGLV